MAWQAGQDHPEGPNAGGDRGPQACLYGEHRGWLFHDIYFCGRCRPNGHQASKGLQRQAGGPLFGLYIAGLLRIPWLMWERRLSLEGQQGTALGAALVGVTFGSAWTPCVGPNLGSILLLASTAGSAAVGVKLLTAYSLGLAAPFFLGSLAVERSLRFLDRFRRWLPLVDKAAGAILVTMGILVFTNYVSVLNTYFIQFTPQWLWKRL
jgi:cytochrome c-type biogenesis protein